MKLKAMQFFSLHQCCQQQFIRFLFLDMWQKMYRKKYLMSFQSGNRAKENLAQ